MTKRVTKICTYCQKSFAVFPCVSKRSTVKFCSQTCMGLSRSIRAARVTRTCKTCGKGMSVLKSKVKVGGGKYCSQDCYGLSRPGKLKKQCAHCQKSFMIYPSALKRGEGKFCGLVCMGLATKGVNNPNYKGGHISIAGYRIIYIKGSQVYEHRYLMEQHLGRKLTPDEVIHHKNGIRDDNIMKNLHLMNQSEHIKLHQKEEILCTIVI